MCSHSLAPVLADLRREQSAGHSVPIGQDVLAEVIAKRVLRQHMPFKAFMQSGHTLGRCRRLSVDCKLQTVY